MNGGELDMYARILDFSRWRIFTVKVKITVLLEMHFLETRFAYSKNEGFRRTIYRLKLVKHHLLTLSVSRATIDGVNDARFL